MKFLTICLCLCLNFTLAAFSASDTLLIYLNNNTIDKIDVSQISYIKFENLTDVKEFNTQSNSLSVNGNRPNPAFESTLIEFENIEPGNIEINIFNQLGELINTLSCSDCNSGKNALLWNCKDKNNQSVKSGSYYYEVKFRSEIQTRKMIVIK